MKKIIAVILFSFIFSIGCKDEQEEEDYSIGQITITGIPALIPVAGNENVKNETYRVYLNASNSQSEYERPVAKGVGVITPGMKQANGTFTVTINLQKPNPLNNKNPKLDTGPWSGTANYFSVMISPQDVSGGVNTVLVKAGTTLDKGKASCDWNGLMDLRALGLHSKINALFGDIVCEDPDITKSLK